MKDTLVVISGGGFSQLENALGCLKAIGDSGRVDLHSSAATAYQATSAGAIASGMMMSTMSPDAAITLIKKTPTSKLIYKKWFWPMRMWFGHCAIYDRTGLETFMQELYKDGEYSNVTVTVTKLTGFKCEYLPGRYQSILASTSIQGVFPATTVNKIKYIDGGYSDNVPVKDWQLDNYRHTYIILYPDDPDKDRHRLTAIGRLLAGLDTKISQEVNEAESIYDDKVHYPNVTVLRPPPTTTNLLDWSKDCKLVNHAYKYSVDKLQKEGLWQ